MNVPSLAPNALNGGSNQAPRPAQVAAPAGNAAPPAQPIDRAAASAAAEVRPTLGANIAVDPQELQQALNDVQAAIQPVANELTFSIDRESGRTLVKVVDSQTDEIIRQIPSEELLRIAKALDKLQGLLLKQEA